MFLGLLITARCNAACLHCSTSCGPSRTEALGEHEIVRLMDEAAGIHDGSALQFCFSGGEVFLDFGQLLRLVAHGKRLGAAVDCVSNGYWASTDARAQARLEALRDCGLRGIALSTSRFHQQFIRRERVERALRIARALGFYTVLKCPLTRSDRNSDLERWARAVDVDELEVFPVLPHLRQGAALPASDYDARPGLPDGACPGAVLTVREDGNAYTCCNAGGFNDFLRLGSIRERPLEGLARDFRIGGRQRLLRLRGPAYFARKAVARGLGGRLRESYGSVCELCAHIGSDRALADCAAQVADSFEKGQVRALLSGMRKAPAGRP